MKKLVFLILGVLIFVSTAMALVNFEGTELLGCPTDHSVNVNVIADTAIEAYFEYGTTSGVYTGQTSTVSASADEPLEVVIDGLDTNTKYYYRMVYSDDGGSNWYVRDEHSFHTQRLPGDTFTFTIISDSHAMYNTQYQQAMENVLADNPDFHFDLGDTFMTDSDTSQSQVDTEYLAQRDELYIGKIGPSVPIFLASGNHENEEGWNLDDTPFSIGVASIQARKMYFPTPNPNDGSFYSTNTDPLARIDETTYGDEYREDYYAWTWGDALFVVIDPYHYTMSNPYGASAGEGSDDPATNDPWDWTLGEDQYLWFKNILENSDAKYKFIFAHHVVGGKPSYTYVRGGAEAVPYYEWGGYSWSDTWQFDTERSGWYTPVHQLMVENNVSAFFHGHDHQYAYEKRDDVVYQCLPRPSTGMDFNYYSESNPYTIKVLPSSGHLRVTVTSEEATVDYVRSNQEGVSYSYTIEPKSSGSTNHDLTMDVDPEGTGNTNPSVGVHSYPEDEIVTISAEALSGYIFDYWEGDVADPNSATTTVTMDEDQEVTAHFTEGECETDADTSGDGEISMTELMEYIGRWKIGEVEMTDLMKAIGFWKAGEGC